MKSIEFPFQFGEDERQELANIGITDAQIAELMLWNVLPTQ